MTDGTLYLSARALQSIGITGDDLLAALRVAFAARADGKAVMPTKLALKPPDAGSFFHAMAAALPNAGYAGVKWVSGASGNSAQGLPHITGLQILNDVRTGQLLALLDGGYLTGLRTAAVSLLAADLLADRNSTSLALVGTGLQARSHLELFRARFPLSEVFILGRTPASIQALAAEAESAGLAVNLPADPARALEAADIVVSTVPAQPGLVPFLDARRMRPGAFAAMVDLGRSWTDAGFGCFSFVATDDREQSSALAQAGNLTMPRPFDADLGEILTGRVPFPADGRNGPMAFLFPGSAVADIAVAALIYERARDRGIGTVLPA